MSRYGSQMPEFLKPDRFTLSLDDGIPTITLHGATASNTNGWSFLNRATLLVVDGPGEEGFLLRRMDSPGADLAPEGWDEAVASTGSVRLLASGVRITAHVIE
jgi:hypothetical protein